MLDLTKLWEAVGLFVAMTKEGQGDFWTGVLGVLLFVFALSYTVTVTLLPFKLERALTIYIDKNKTKTTKSR